MAESDDEVSTGSRQDELSWDCLARGGAVCEGTCYGCGTDGFPVLVPAWHQGKYHDGGRVFCDECWEDFLETERWDEVDETCIGCGDDGPPVHLVTYLQGQYYYPAGPWHQGDFYCPACWDSWETGDDDNWNQESQECYWDGWHSDGTSTTPAAIEAAIQRGIEAGVQRALASTGGGGDSSSVRGSSQLVADATARNRRNIALIKQAFPGHCAYHLYHAHVRNVPVRGCKHATDGKCRNGLHDEPAGLGDLDLEGY